MAEDKEKQPNPLKIVQNLFGFRPPINVPGTINESRRALAILRSAESGKFIRSLRNSLGQPMLTRIQQPSVGRNVSLSSLYYTGKNKPSTTLDFFGRNLSLKDDPFGVRVDKNGKVVRLAAPNLAQNARYQGLKFNLGQALAMVPEGSFKGQGTTPGRRALYMRGSGGAIGPSGQAFVRPDGNWMPRNLKGQFGKMKPNPAVKLQSGLRTLAAGNVTRQALPVLKRVLNVDPRVQAMLQANDVIEAATGKGPLAWFADFATDYKKDTGVSLNPASFFP